MHETSSCRRSRAIVSGGVIAAIVALAGCGDQAEAPAPAGDPPATASAIRSGGGSVAYRGGGYFPARYDATRIDRDPEPDGMPRERGYARSSHLSDNDTKPYQPQAHPRRGGFGSIGRSWSGFSA